MVKVLTVISPFRYASESMMRSMLSGKRFSEKIYDQFKFDYGQDMCNMAILLSAVLFFFMGWEAIEM